MPISKELVELVREAGKAVAELPEAVQPAAFQFLVERYVGRPERVPARPQEAVSAEPGTDSEWASRLGHAGGVKADEVRSLLLVDEDGIHLVTNELGGKEAERNRNGTVLVLWAARVLNRDIYYPAAEVRRALKEVKLPLGNFVHAVRRERCVKSLRVRGQTMLQLSGNWQERVSEMLSQLGG